MGATWLAIDFDPYAFACDGPLFGIPHFWNVATNLPFFAVGVWGLWRIARGGAWGDVRFHAWKGLWISVVLLTFGSGAYHWDPRPLTLALDRATICGMIAFLAAHLLVVTLGWAPRPARAYALLGACELAVVVWYLGGGVWLYALLQGGGGLAVIVLLVRAHRAGRLGTSPKPLVGFLVCYALAKVVEVLDVPVCELTGWIGGHPIKHLLSALGLVYLGGMMTAELARRGRA